MMPPENQLRREKTFSGGPDGRPRRLMVRFVLVLMLCAAPLFLAAFCASRARLDPPPPGVVYEQCESNRITAADCSGWRLAGPQPRNVILFIGDGMGYNQIYAARVFFNGPGQPLALETLPARGSVSTCSIDDVTDSAAAATAISTGRKTLNGALAVEAMPRYERLENLHDRLQGKKAFGVVSTASIWDATPAAFVAHAPLREQDRSIACEMIRQSRPEVIMGGGALAFEGDSPCPGENVGAFLLAEAEREGYQLLTDRAQLLGSLPAPGRKVLGLFAAEDMTWQSERPEQTREPLLSEMAAYALKTLDEDPRGFFLMVEGGRIDHACHETDLEKLLGEMAEFDRTVAMALRWARERGDTLVLVTADHETGGMELVPAAYARGETVKVKWTRRVLPGYAQHSSQRVPIFGFGPGAEMIRPQMDNTELRCLIDQALE